MPRAELFLAPSPPLVGERVGVRGVLDQDAALAFAPLPPSPQPSPASGRGCKTEDRAINGQVRRTEHSNPSAEEVKNPAQKLAHHISRSREINRHERSDVP